MSDVRRTEDAQANAKELEQSYTALAAVGSLLTQTLQAEATIKFRIAELEHEIQLLRAQLDRTTPAAESLRNAMSQAQESVRQRRAAAEAAAAIAPRAEASEPNPARELVSKTVEDGSSGTDRQPGRSRGRRPRR
jgi:predicted  nucleic acid-binding Zn-ribbon protein